MHLTRNEYSINQSPDFFNSLGILWLPFEDGKPRTGSIGYRLSSPDRGIENIISACFKSETKGRELTAIMAFRATYLAPRNAKALTRRALGSIGAWR